MEQDLGKAFSALRLAEAKNTQKYQKYPNSAATKTPPSYGYKTVIPQVKYDIDYDPTESVYANLQELSAGPVPSRAKPRFPDPYIPPPKQFSHNVVQVAHVPTQSKVSLEEAMRYTPPNMMNPEETPVYENLQQYSMSTISAQTPYHPVSSNVSESKTDAYFATQQSLQQPIFFAPQQQTSLQCDPYLQAPQQRGNAQRFSQPSPSPAYSPLPPQSATGYDKSPQYNKQRFSQASPIPLATIPSRKVNTFYYHSN